QTPARWARSRASSSRRSRRPSSRTSPQPTSRRRYAPLRAAPAAWAWMWKACKERVMAEAAKRMKTWKSRIVPGKAYPIDEALGLVKEFATAKFDEAVDVAVNLGI